MNRKLFTITLIALLALLLSVGGATGQEPEGETKSQQGDATIAATVNSRISYQGVLKEGGNPVTGSRNMTFRLYSNSSCTTQVDSIVKNGVPVTDGLFSVELDVDSDDFNGQGLWLRVQVGSTSLGCEEILPVPYALSLRPMARIFADNSDYSLYIDNDGTGDGIRAYADATASDYAALYGRNTGTGTGVYGRSSGGYGVYGLSDSTSGRGVYGYANASTGTTYGVRGESSSTSGRGMYGYASASTGTTYGVYGYSASTSGRGMYGYASASTGTTYGVYGYSASTSGRGVYGYASATAPVGAPVTYGVYGKSASDNGRGVYGESPDTGVFGYSSSTVGLGTGVFGKVESSYDRSSGVYGRANASTGETYGVWGQTDSSSQNAYGVYGMATSTTGDVKGVSGETWSTTGGVAVVGVSYGNRHAGWFATGNWESVKVLNDSSTVAGLWVDNSHSSGPLIGAANGTDTEFWVDGYGDVYIDGTLHENLGDYADMLPAVEGLEAGDVLIIGPDGKLTRCTRANQTAVAGVYSTDPGIVGRPFNPTYDADDPNNESVWTSEPFPLLTTDESSTPDLDASSLADTLAELDEGFVPLALAGVVPVKVSAENGPIQPGDLLTTASLAGHAMKASPVDLGGVEIYRPGTIIGKALEPLAEGTGVIQVLVTLQ